MCRARVSLKDKEIFTVFSGGTMQKGVSSSAKHQSSKSIQKFTIYNLPEEVISYIFSFLPLNDLSHVLLVDKYLSRIAQDNSLWKRFLLQFFDDKQALAAQDLHQSFLQKLSSAFDRRLFPNLNSKQSLTAAMQGDMKAIVNSKENLDNKSSLLGAAVAMGHTEIIPHIETRIEDLVKAKALAYATVNQNRILPEILPSLISIDFNLQKIIFRTLIQKERVDLLNGVLVKFSVQELKNLLEIVIENHGIKHPLSQAILKSFNSAKKVKDQYTFHSRKIYVKEAAQNGKSLEYMKLRSKNQTTQLVAVREMPLDLTEQQKSEKRRLKRLPRNIDSRKKIAKIAIEQGYVHLLEELEAKTLFQERDYPLLGLGNNMLDNRSFDVRVIDKAFLRAIRMNLPVQVKEHVKKASSFLISLAFVHVVSESNFLLMNIILDNRGKCIHTSFLNKAISLCNDDKAKKRIQKEKVFVQNPLKSIHELVTSVLGENVNFLEKGVLSNFFSQEITDYQPIDDLTHPVTLTLNFNRHYKTLSTFQSYHDYINATNFKENGNTKRARR